MHRSRWVILRSRLAALLLLCCHGAGLQAVAAECKGEDGGTALVTEIQDGETLILEDGRALRLAGVLGPKRARGGPASQARGDMEQALTSLLLGKKVTLQLAERKRDRYGRILAQVMIAEENETTWVQERLVADGLVRVISFPDNRLCTAELLAKEDEARRGQQGLWKSGFFAIREANAEDLLYRLVESYEIVEGRVRNVAEIRGRTYINFGDNWRRDFTAFIAPQTSARSSTPREELAPSRIDAASLNGKRVRVRGWLKNFNGPSITVTHPEQIEILEQNAAAASPPDQQ